MDSRPLQETGVRYFLEVVRCGSITAASERLNVGASAISRQIATLEEHLGAALFERHARGMVPSSAGEVLAAYAYKAAQDADRVAKEIQALSGLKTGLIRLCSTEGMAMEFVPRAMLDFQERYPGVQFELDVGETFDVSRRLREGDADVGLTFSRVAEKDIKVEYNQRSPIMAVMRPTHPLSGAERVTLQQLAAYPLALPPVSTTIRQLFDIACSARAIPIVPALCSNSASAVYDFVANSDAITLSGRVAVSHRLAAGTLAAVPVRERGMAQRDIEIQTLAGRSLPALVQEFVGFLATRLAPLS